jgi:NitT/TauT family transport system substrate-binding protein
MHLIQTRRQLLTSMTAAGTAALLGPQKSLADQAPPETSTVRICRQTGTCTATQYLAEDLLRADGFTEVHFEGGAPCAKTVGLGEVDFGLAMAPSILFQRQAGLPVTALAGVHPGCWELFAHPPIRTISDLKGKTVDTSDPFGSGAHLFMAIMAAHVGLDLRKDINWVAAGGLMPSIDLFAQHKTDAFLASSPPRGRPREPGGCRKMHTSARMRPDRVGEPGGIPIRHQGGDQGSKIGRNAQGWR